MWLPLTYILLEAWPATQACALTGNRTGDPLVLRPVLNPLSHISQSYNSIILKTILFVYCLIDAMLGKHSLGLSFDLVASLPAICVRGVIYVVMEYKDSKHVFSSQGTGHLVEKQTYKM